MNAAHPPAESVVRYPTNESSTANAAPAWDRFYQVAGVAAIIAAVLFTSTIVLSFAVGVPVPTTVSEWFTLLNEHLFAGIVFLALTDTVGAVLLVPLVLALYETLRHRNPPYAALALVFASIALAMMLAANSSYSLLHLSSRYQAVATDAERAQIMTAAETVLAHGTWSTGAIVASILFEGAMAAFSLLMLRNRDFGRTLGYLGLVGHGFDIAHTLALLVLVPLVSADTAMNAGMLLLALGGPFQLIWYPLVGLKLWRLGRTPAAPKPS